MLESYVTKRRDKKVALKFFRKAILEFAAVLASIHNHFNQERHLFSGDNFKLNRARRSVRVAGALR